MISEKVKITNQAGIHARSVSLFIRTASEFKSNITIENKGKKGNGKCLLNIIALCITAGSEITIEAEGTDEKESVEALVKLVESKFQRELQI